MLCCVQFIPEAKEWVSHTTLETKFTEYERQDIDMYESTWTELKGSGGSSQSQSDVVSI